VLSQVQFHRRKRLKATFRLSKGSSLRRPFEVSQILSQNPQASQSPTCLCRVRGPHGNGMRGGPRGLSTGNSRSVLTTRRRPHLRPPLEPLFAFSCTRCRTLTAAVGRTRPLTTFDRVDFVPLIMAVLPPDVMHAFRVAA